MNQNLFSKISAKLTRAMILFFLTLTASGAAGDLDTTFNGTGKLRTAVGGGEDTANAIVRQTDGKLVVAGQSADITGNNFSLVRYNTNGTLDATFGAGGKVLTLIGGGATSVAVQPDGKILAAGSSSNGTTTDFALVRYNSNGTIDTTFGVNGIVVTDFGANTTDVVNALAIQTSGTTVVNIIVVGSSTVTFQLPTVAIARYNSNGALDASFDGDGKLTSSLGNRANAVGLQSGKIVVAGDGCNGSCGVLLRFNTNGTFDTTFGGASGVTLTDGSSNTTISTRSLAFYAVFAGEDKIVVAGDTRTPGGMFNPGSVSVRLWSRDANNGTPDTTFGSGGLVKLSDDTGTGKSVKISFNNGVANRLVVGTNKEGFGVYRLTLAGALDTAFDGDGFASASIGNNDLGNAMLVQPDNRIVVAGMTRQTIISNVSFGSATLIYSDTDFGLVRFNSNGTLDTTFDGDGKKAEDVGNKNAAAKSILVQPDGKIVVAGDFAVTRFNTDGTFDTSFDGDGKTKIPFGTITGAAIQPDGKIVVVAGVAVPVLLQPPPFLVYRFTASGALDTTFDTDGMALVNIPNNSAFANAVGIQPDGGIVVAGYATNSSGNADFAAARFLPNGAVDTSFDNDGLVTTAIGTGNDVGTSLAIQPDGRIIVAGSAIFGSTTDFALVRYNPDGSLDTTFSFDGKQTTAVGTSSDVANALAIQTDYKIVAAGYANISSGNNDFAAVRYNTDGSLDSTFGTGGKVLTAVSTLNDVGNAVTVQTDGKVLIAGSTETVANVINFAVVRYNSNGSLDNLFGSGGKKTVDVGGDNDLGNAIASDSSGRAIIAGAANGLFGIVRLLGDAPLAQTYEGDVASRPNGDGMIASNDVVQVTRFVNELDAPSVTPNEFQRADSAPRTSGGNGSIDSSDIVQTIRYLNELDAAQFAGGPSVPNGSRSEDDEPADASFDSNEIDQADLYQQSGKVSSPQVAPELRVESTSGSAGNQVSVNIRVDATGNEAQYAFAVLVDPNVLTFAGFAAGGTTSQTFSCNGTATAGRVRCSIGAFTGNQAGSNTNTIGEIAPGNNQILIKVNFTVAANAQANTTTAVNLGSQSASDDSANSITPAVTNGTVTIAGATAAGAAISGRVLTAAGRGVANAIVNLTDAAGGRRTARTNGFGYYRFDDLAAGQSVIMTVVSKRYKYLPQVINLTESLSDVNFISQPLNIQINQQLEKHR